MADDVVEANEAPPEGGIPGEVVPEDPYRPRPPTADSLWTPTVCPESVTPTLLFGDFKMSAYRTCPQLTLFLVKPDGMRYADEMERIIRDEGFFVTQRRFLQLSPEQASNFYYEHYGEPYFPSLIMALCEGPIRVLVLHRKESVETLRELCGPRSVDEARKIWPASLRARFGTPGQDHKNACHASESPEKALEEIRFFFPHMILGPNIRDEIEVEDYINDQVNPTLVEGLAQVCKHKPIDPVLWLAEWLLMNNPNKPKMQKIITMTPT